MAKAMKDLQTLIEERAGKRLEQDLVAFGDWLMKQPLLAYSEYDGGPPLAINQGWNKTINGEQAPQKFNVASRWDLFNTNHGEPRGLFLQQLYKYWLPKYIEEESRVFLQKVDEMQENLDYLLNN